eukprot:1383260-Pyramimonas_sp.AAC.1
MLEPQRATKGMPRQILLPVALSARPPQELVVPALTALGNERNKGSKQLRLFRLAGLHMRLR